MEAIEVSHTFVFLLQCSQKCRFKTARMIRKTFIIAATKEWMDTVDDNSLKQKKVNWHMTWNISYVIHSFVKSPLKTAR